MILTKPWKSLSFLMAVTLGTLASPASILVAQETWTKDSDGKTLTAEFVKLEGVQLTLKKADGKEIVLPLSMLDDKSRLKARAIANFLSRFRESIVHTSFFSNKIALGIQLEDHVKLKLGRALFQLNTR